MAKDDEAQERDRPEGGFFRRRRKETPAPPNPIPVAAKAEAVRAADGAARLQTEARTQRHRDMVERKGGKFGYDAARPVTVIPPITNPHHREVEFTTIIPDRAHVRIVFDEETQRPLYETIEPQLSETEAEVLRFVRDTLVRTLEGRHDKSEAQWQDHLLESVDRAIVDHSVVIDDVGRERIKYYIVRDFVGYGRIDVLMHDPQIEDISCDGPGIPLFVFHRKHESTKTSIMFPNELELDGFVIRLSQRCGKQISIANPLLDATLPDKSRLQCSLSKEVTTRGSSFTIRRFRADPFTPPDLIKFGTMSAQMAAYFWFLIEEGKSLLIAGGTASGKTSTMNAISIFIPPQKKIVTIEDTREINLPHENWIAGLTRTGFGTDANSQGMNINMYKLLEAALRQRPEYLIVGEVRGQEAMTLFQAMATGHAAYGTMHADSATSAVYRLENPPINLPRIMLQTLGAIVVQGQVRTAEGKTVRRVKEIVEINGIDPESGDLLTNTVFLWDPATDRHEYLGKSVVLDAVREKRALSFDAIDNEWDRRIRILNWMERKGIRSLRDVVRVVSGYTSQPQKIMDQVEADEKAQVDGGPAA